MGTGIHHIGDPYVGETISIASRFENVYLVLPLWFNQYFLQPRKMLHRLGECLLYVGEGMNSSIAYTKYEGVTTYFHVAGKTEASAEPFDGSMVTSRPSSRK